MSTKVRAFGVVAAVAVLGGAVDASAQELPLVRLDTLRMEVASHTASAFPARSRVVQVLTATDLRALPVRNVQDALQWITAADVQPRSAAQADLSLRGSTFEQVLVLVDGVRMSDPQTGHFDLDLTVPLDRVERIEVLEGPASALYGSDALGGVVNIVTKDGGTAVSAMGERGTFDTWRAALSADGQSGRVRIGVGGEWDDSDGHRVGTDYESYLVNGRVSVTTGPGALTAQAGYAVRNFGANGFYAARDSYEETRARTASLGWAGDVGGGFTLSARANARGHKDDFTLIRTNPAVYENVHDLKQGGAEILLRRPALTGLTMAVGGETYRDQIESDNKATPAVDDALGERTDDRAAGFGEIGWGDERASVSAGLRGDWHEGFGDSWSPSISASFDPTGSLRLRGALGRSFRAPSWTERYYKDAASIGDPNLKPERSWSGELGADLALPRTGVVRVTGFHRVSEDLIDWVRPVGTPATTPSTVKNIKEATYDGIEVGIDGMVLADFVVDASGSWLSVEADEAAGTVSRYALKPLVERALVGVTRSLLADQLTLSARWQRDRRRLGTAYQLLGARVRVRVPRGEIDLNGTNLTDETYMDITNNPAAGRALSVGYRLDLSR